MKFVEHFWVRIFHGNEAIMSTWVTGCPVHNSLREWRFEDDLQGSFAVTEGRENSINFRLHFRVI